MKYLKQISAIMLNLLPNSECLTDFLVIAAEQNPRHLINSSPHFAHSLHSFGSSTFQFPFRSIH